MSIEFQVKSMVAAAMVFGFMGTMTNPAHAAPEVTPWARVNAIQVGWVVDRLLVFHNTPGLTNPNGCTVVNNGYIIKETDPGRKTSYAMLLSAVLNQREVAMVIDGCFEARPRIISVSIR